MNFDAHASLDTPLLKELNELVLTKFREREQKTHEEASMPMENLKDPASVGPGIAVAFVATVYGVGSANLVFLPLATRLRSLGRAAALSREVVIEGAVAIQQGIHPTLVDGHLQSLLLAWHGVPRAAKTPPKAPPVATLVKS